ncbi:MAG: amidohydrolase family protein [Planctomycetota bacterium]
MKFIDAHVHIGNGVRAQLDVVSLLRQMDQAELALAVVCPLDRFIAVDNKQGNDFVINAVQSQPDRLVGLATANPWFGQSAVEEVRRALSKGLAGVKIHSVLQGFRLSEHIIDPILEVAAEFDVPVYAHTGTAGVAEPFHLIELARRFSTINFIMGHGGASDYYNDSVRGLEFVENVWLETSRNGPANYCLWKNAGLMDKIVFGSNAPNYIPQVEIETLKDVFTDPQDQEKILSLNIQNVFKERLPL